VSQSLLSALEMFFGCYHSNQSRPFTQCRRTYKVCLDCGKEIPHSGATMSALNGRHYADVVSIAKTARWGRCENPRRPHGDAGGLHFAWLAHGGHAARTLAGRSG